MFAYEHSTTPPCMSSENDEKLMSAGTLIKQPVRLQQLCHVATLCGASWGYEIILGLI